MPSVVLGGDVPTGTQKLEEAALAPALSREGGVICLIEADGADSVGLGQLAAAVQNAPHKPRLVVVARAFNPFALPSALRTLKFEHEKGKPRDFLFRLPVPAPTAANAAAAAPAPEPKKKSGAPRIAFVGREEELAWLGEHAAGPVVVVGPPGVGKRWLVEKALSGTEGRAPDFVLARGAEADSLYARIAGLGVDAGDKRLAEALQKPDQRPQPAALAALAAEVLATVPATLVIERLENVMRRDGTFHRESRLELLLRALLAGRYQARVIFCRPSARGSTVRARAPTCRSSS